MSTALTEIKTSISEGELTQRMAVVKRFRELLEMQRERFRSYLAALDSQQLIIGIDSAEEITAHIELEEQIVEDIYSIQKVIDPLEIMYNSAGPYLPANDLSALKAALEDLKIQAADRSRRNRDLISRRMEEINKELQSMKNNPFLANARFSLYKNVPPSLVDIMG
jgi:hypothetical protein